MTDSGMISVCMTTYNGEKYLQDQLNSILTQLGTDDELVISDDGSVDDTLIIIKATQDKRIKLLQNNGRKGVVGNFENALRAAQGQYIFLSDQDDVWLPGKVATCVKLLKNYALIVTNCYVVDYNLKPGKQSYFEVFNSNAGILKNLKRNTYQGCCMCFRRQVLQIALPFPSKLPMHDSWLGFAAELMHKVHFEPAKWSLYRRHNSTVTSAKVGQSIASLRKQFLFRYHLLRYLPLLLLRWWRNKKFIQS